MRHSNVFSVPPTPATESELISREEATARQPLSTAGRERGAHQQCLSKSFPRLSLYFLMEEGWKRSALRRKNVLIKHSV